MKPLLVALPKGRLFDKSLDLLAQAGVSIRPNDVDSRKLTFTDRDNTYEFVSLKPVDVPVYVESGAVDCGIVGSDILRETEHRVYEPLDLRIGRCRLVVAAPEGRDLAPDRHLKIATKYPRTTERHFRERSAHIHVVKLEGSVEIAPLLGLSDAIVDLVESGRTLRDNHLVVVEEVASVSAKLVVNRTAMTMKARVLNTLISQLDRVVYADH
jgi:ATP phosphoribosyltransferase